MQAFYDEKTEEFGERLNMLRESANKVILHVDCSIGKLRELCCCLDTDCDGVSGDTAGER